MWRLLLVTLLRLINLASAFNFDAGEAVKALQTQGTSLFALLEDEVIRINTQTRVVNRCRIPSDYLKEVNEFHTFDDYVIAIVLQDTIIVWRAIDDCDASRAFLFTTDIDSNVTSARFSNVHGGVDYTTPGDEPVYVFMNAEGVFKNGTSFSRSYYFTLYMTPEWAWNVGDFHYFDVRNSHVTEKPKVLAAVVGSDRRPYTVFSEFTDSSFNPQLVFLTADTRRIEVQLFCFREETCAAFEPLDAYFTNSAIVVFSYSPRYRVIRIIELDRQRYFYVANNTACKCCEWFGGNFLPGCSCPSPTHNCYTYANFMGLNVELMAGDEDTISVDNFRALYLSDRFYAYSVNNKVKVVERIIFNPSTFQPTSFSADIKSRALADFANAVGDGNGTIYYSHENYIVSAEYSCALFERCSDALNAPLLKCIWCQHSKHKAGYASSNGTVCGSGYKPTTDCSDDDKLAAIPEEKTCHLSVVSLAFSTVFLLLGIILIFIGIAVRKRTRRIVMPSEFSSLEMLRRDGTPRGSHWIPPDDQDS